MNKKLAILGLIIILLFTSFFIYPVNGIKTMALIKGKYKYDGNYIIDIPGYTTVKEFKRNVLSLFKVKVEGVTKEDKEYIKTGDVIKVGGQTYTAVVTGDIDGDGKCTYKDILMEQWIYDNPNSDFVEYANMIKSRRRSRGSTNASSGEIIQTSIDVLESMLSTGRGMHYGTAGIWKDIEKSASSDSYVCATYVAVVLYESGALTEDQINKFNYHYTGAGGIPDMLEDAGWYQVSVEEAEPGDVINVYGYHVLIYAGGDDCYDETCAQDFYMSTPRNLWPAYKNDSRTQVWRAPYTNSSTSEKLKTTLDDARTTAISASGGDWAIYAESLSYNEQATSNNMKMQAASLIKLFIMGAVYEDYDNLKSRYSSIDNDLYNMITVSDNTAANNLVTLLGNGDSSVGRDKVTKYCSSHGYTASSMGRMLLDSTATGDNYTSVSDCGKFLKSVYKGELSHSKDMLNLLRQQQRQNKIPAGIPGVKVANKTGELSDVENDAAIILTDKPYILVVMSQGLSNTSMARTQIQSISKKVYEYFKNSDGNNSSGKKTVVIDAGHQAHGDSSQEPIGPGATEMKPKVADGTQGVATGIPEYELTLALAKKVGAILEQKGYNVIQIRTSNNVNISNSERA